MLIPISSVCGYISFPPWACELGLACTIASVRSLHRAWGKERRVAGRGPRAKCFLSSYLA